MTEETEKKLPADWWNRLNKYSYIFVPTEMCLVPALAVVSVLSLAFFITFIVAQTSVVEHRKRYDKDGLCEFSGSKMCSIDLEIDEDIDGPLFVYYEVRGFYQNHRRYAKSYDLSQLIDSDNSDLSNCEENIYRLKDLKDHLTYQDFTLINDNDNDIADPCGLIAGSFFNDTFVARATSGGVVYEMEKDDIILKGDEDTFENSGKQWLNKEDERFKVWMRTALSSNFRKLYGVIDRDIDKDEGITMDITLKSDYSVFGGEKYIVVMTANALGTYNYVLGWFFFLAFFGSTGVIVASFVLKKTKKVIGPEEYFNLTEEYAA